MCSGNFFPQRRQNERIATHKSNVGHWAVGRDTRTRFARQARSTLLLYEKFNVKRGLRNADGTGVLVGLTCIGAVHGYIISESEKVSVPGQLFYRGINVNDLVHGFQSEKRFGFEETAYLLLFGELPKANELKVWNGLLDSYRRLPDGFKESAIIRAPGKDSTHWQVVFASQTGSAEALALNTAKRWRWPGCRGAMPATECAERRPAASRRALSAA